MAIGQTIRGLRSKQGLSQEAFADEAGVDRSYMGGVERGEHNVTIINLLRICRALDMTTSDLLRRAGL